MSAGKVAEVRRPGLFTTVQDKGRYGYQCFGVPISGPMDWLSAEIGNRLVGNPPDAALLEITLGDFQCAFPQATWVAVTGADVAIALLSGAQVEPWVPFLAQAGDELRLSHRPGAQAMRTYLAFGGGLSLEPVLGSLSTFVPADLGPMPRPLRAGDALHLGLPAGEPILRGLPERLRPRYGRMATARVVLGPQADRFSADGLRAFLGDGYYVTPQSDRTGYRLQGAPIGHTGAADIISDPIPTGAVQVPGSGQPVLLLADHRVTGGYAKIATVIGRDLPEVGQLKPGGTIRFEAVTVEEAMALRRELRRSLAAAGFA